MSTLWLNIKIWTKIVSFSVIALLVIIILLLNRNTRVPVDLLFVKYDQPHLLSVLFLTSFLSILGWWLFLLVFKAIGQIRAARRLSRQGKANLAMTDMTSKVAKLQTLQPRPNDRRS